MTAGLMAPFFAVIKPGIKPAVIDRRYRREHVD
jgi:hypothetical protein